MLLLLPSLICAAGGMMVPLFRNRKGRNGFVFGVTLAVSLLLCFLTLRGDVPEWTLMRVTPLFTLAFRLDAVNRVFLLLIAFLWPLAALYAFEYMEHETREGRFFLFYTLSYAVTMLLALSANLFTLYILYECLTLVTLPLVTHKEDEDSLRAGMTYLKYTIGGAALGLAGLIVLGFYGASGSFTPGGLIPGTLSASRADYLRAAYVAAFLGFAAKAAIFPLSPWLPRASVAPTPVTALLHAVAVVNAGVFACLRLTYDCFGTELLSGSWAQTAVILLSAFTILFGAVLAVRERHLKRRLAWSTVYHLSYMLFSLSLMTPAGMNGALTHLVFHGIMKITLFFCAGAFLIRAEAEYLPELRGLGHAMPWTVGVYTLAGLALTGIPPLIGFLSKWAILSAAVPAGSWPAWVGAAAVILSSVLACVYLLEPAVQMIFLPGKHPDRIDPSWRMLVPLCVLSALIVLLGIWPAPVREVISAAVSLYEGGAL